MIERLILEPVVVEDIGNDARVQVFVPLTQVPLRVV
jgi:hypothetical protein